MKLHPRLSRAAVELVTRFETFQPLAQPASVGGWTVGYGHTRSARHGAQVTCADAEALLLYDLSAAADGVEAALFAPVTQRQFEALTAFAFNIGADNFRRSTALARVNAGAELEAADEIERWRHAELGAGAQVVDALVRRRAAEKAHFLGLPEGFSKSPRAVLRPLALEGGHEPEPPPIEAVSPSATLTAANTVQARLRQLVPDPEPAPIAVPVEEEAEALGAEIEVLAPPPASEPPAVTSAAPAPYAPPPPPIHEEALASLAPNDAVLPPIVHPEAPPRPAETPTATAEAPSTKPAPRRSISPRALYAALIALGACLFVTAAVMILGGKASFGDLGLGVAGVVLMTPGVYGLLGPGRATA